MKGALKYLGYPLLVPRTLVGLFIFAVFYRAHSWRWNDGCIECIAGEFIIDNEKEPGKFKWQTRIWGRPGAQTWGIAIVYKSFEHAQREGLRVHERIHIWQAILALEVPFLIVYGGHFVLHYAIDGGRERWVIDLVGHVRPHAVPEFNGWILFKRVGERWKRAYLKICWERQAYRLQGDFLDGKRVGAWGSSP